MSVLSGIPGLIKALLASDRKQALIAEGLSSAYRRAGDARRFDLAGDRLIVLSDHHRGNRDAADDFLRCEGAYRAALGWYLEAGHTLALLGDVEELWECRAPGPLDNYGDILALEREFHDRDRLWRFFGNHDIVWSGRRAVDKHLASRFHKPIEILEAVKLDVYDGGARLGRLFVVHGHQGTLDSDVLRPFAMIPVRYVWPAVQRKVKFASTTPARDFDLRAAHDAAMFAWARGHRDRPVIVCGHTHKPIFRRRAAAAKTPVGARPEADIGADLDAARGRGAPAEELAALRAELEYVLTPPFGPPPIPVEPPCYFNTGCCSFGDGDVTGIEIADGRIRLVRWLDNEERPSAQILADESLREILAEVARPV